MAYFDDEPSRTTRFKLTLLTLKISFNFLGDLREKCEDNHAEISVIFDGENFLKILTQLYKKCRVKYPGSTYTKKLYQGSGCERGYSEKRADIKRNVPVCRVTEIPRDWNAHEVEVPNGDLWAEND